MSVSSPAWASALGVVAVVLGIFLTAMNGNELMKHAIITQPAGVNGLRGAHRPTKRRSSGTSFSSTATGSSP